METGSFEIFARTDNKIEVDYFGDGFIEAAPFLLTATATFAQYCLVVNRTGNTVTIYQYLNATLQNSASGALNGNANQDDSITIGARADGTGPYEKNIDSLFIINQSYNANNITALFELGNNNGTLKPSPPPPPPPPPSPPLPNEITNIGPLDHARVVGSSFINTFESPNLINYNDTTAHLMYKQGLARLHPETVCAFRHGDTEIPACFSQLNDPVSVSPEHRFQGKDTLLFRFASNDPELLFNISTLSNYTWEMLVGTNFTGNTNVQQFRSRNNDTSMDMRIIITNEPAGSPSTITSTPSNRIVVRNIRDEEIEERFQFINTSITIEKNNPIVNVNWTYFEISTLEKTYFIIGNNWTNVTNTTQRNKSTSAVNNIRTSVTTNVVAYATNYLIYDSKAALNTSASLISHEPVKFKNFSQTYNVFWHGDPSLEILFSCNGGSEFSKITSNNTQQNCSISTNEVIVNINLSSGGNITFFNFTQIQVPDSLPPVINTSIQVLNPKLPTPNINDVINFSGNITDNIGLSTAIIRHNISGATTEIPFNLTGPTATISAIINLNESGFFNFTIFATDTNGNQNQNSTTINVTNFFPPSFANNFTNTSQPRLRDGVAFHIVINDTFNVSNIIFSFDNGTGTFINDSPIDIHAQGVSSINITVNKTVEVGADTTLQWIWFANNTLGLESNNGINSLLVAGNTSPNAILNPNNFFSENNDTVLRIDQVTGVLLNFTLTDDINLFGYILNITDDNDVSIFNITDLTIGGTVFNFSQTIDVSPTVSNYTVNLTIFDSHTKKRIPDFKVKKGLNYLEFEGKIRITAKNAIFSNTKKKNDRYTFEFNYLPLIAPKKKQFTLESDSNLVLITDSGYKAHFVDFQNRKWIDFQGLEGNPEIKKINNKKWTITYETDQRKVRFNSIGALNVKILLFTYSVINTTAEYFIPKDSDDNTILTETITISLNVTGDGRNTTTFRLFNGSKTLLNTTIISDTGSGSFFYNVTFDVSSGRDFFVNASHEDILGTIINLTDIRFRKLILTNKTFAFPAINFTIVDELNGSRISSTILANFNYNGTDKTKQTNISLSNVNNFTIRIFPASETAVANFNVTYSATDYQQRIVQFADNSMSNNTQNIQLKLLNNNDGIFANFVVLDGLQNPLTDVKVTVRLNSNIIEVRNTDDSGSVAFFVNPDTTYQFIFEKSGFDTLTKNLRVTSSDVITITLGVVVEDVVTSFSSGINYFFRPTAQTLNNGTDFNFTFNLTSSFFNITGCSLVLQNTSDRLAQLTGNFNGSQCTANITFNTGNQTLIISQATWTINNTNSSAFVQYGIIFTYVGEFSLQTFINDVKSFSEAGFNNFTRFILTVIIIFAITAFISFEIQAFREPEAIVTIVFVLTLLFSFIGFMELSLALPDAFGATKDFMNKFAVAILVGLTWLSYMFRRFFT